MSKSYLVTYARLDDTGCRYEYIETVERFETLAMATEFIRWRMLRSKDRSFTCEEIESIGLVDISNIEKLVKRYRQFLKYISNKKSQTEKEQIERDKKIYALGLAAIEAEKGNE